MVAIAAYNQCLNNTASAYQSRKSENLHHRQTFYFFFCRLSMICESFCTFASIVCLSVAALGGGALAVGDSGSELLQPARKIISKESVPAKTSLLAVRKLGFMVLLQFFCVFVCSCYNSATCVLGGYTHVALFG